MINLWQGLKLIMDAELTFRKTKGSSSREVARRRIIDSLMGSETTSKGDDYIIVFDGEVITAEVAEAEVKKIQIAGGVPEEKTYLASKQYMEEEVAPLALQAMKDAALTSSPDSYKVDPMWKLYDTYIKYMEAKLPLRKFREITSRLNKALGVSNAAVNAFDTLVIEAEKVGIGETVLERPTTMNTPMLEVWKPGVAEKYIVIEKNVNITSAVDAEKEFEAIFSQPGYDRMTPPSSYTGSSVPAQKHFLRIDRPGNLSYIIKGNIGWVRKLIDEGKSPLIFTNVVFETQSLAPLNPTAFVEMNAGHVIGDAVQSANLVAKAEITDAVILHGINPFTGEPFTPELKQAIIAQASIFKDQFDTVKAIDKMQGSFSLESLASQGMMTAKDLIEPFIEFAKRIGSKEIVVIETVAPKKAGAKKSQTQYKYDTRIVSYAEYGRFNKLKGAYQGTRVTAAAKSFSNLIALLVSEVKAYTTDSPSMFSEMVALQLVELLGPLMKPTDKKKIINTLLNQRKAVKRVFFKHNISKPGHLVDLNRVALLAEKEKNEVLASFKEIHSEAKAMVGKRTKILQKRRKLRKLSKPHNPKASTMFNSISIINALNETLREDVINSMDSESLVNRTGKFASSAKVVDANIPTSVGFTYQHDPYRVFSTGHGKPPWNSNPNRDPGSIIRQAIKYSMDKRFPGVFKQTVKVLER